MERVLYGRMDRTQDPLVLKSALKLLARLPDETDQGEALLKMIGDRFPDEAKAAYVSFLAPGTANRRGTMCNVLWYGSPHSAELLAPLLDDTRELPGFSGRMQVCDCAIEAISHAIPKTAFDFDETRSRTRQIEVPKEYLKQTSR